MISIEYIWLGGHNEFRSKVRYLNIAKPADINLDELVWNYDGSSTDQATTESSEIILKPVRMYKDTSSSTQSTYFALCETFDLANNPLKNNYRYSLSSALKDDQSDMWLGFEQEFFVYSFMKKSILGYYPNMPQQGPYYCNVEAVNNYLQVAHADSAPHVLRSLTEEICKRASDLNLEITGWNLEVAPGQTEIQVFGQALKACDDLMMLRYLTHRVLIHHNMKPIYDPKPLGSSWNGSGLHTNISTVDTRKEGGYTIIEEYLKKFEKTHKEHIAVYGEKNEERLTGKHETSSMDKFTWGVASRSTSVRIPQITFLKKQGYFEDRRPASNANPYQVAMRILETLKSPLEEPQQPAQTPTDQQS
jgi:glutamine synthetase